MQNDITERENRIRERARRLWVEAGYPAGRDNEFWMEAESQIEAESLEVRNGKSE